MEASAADKPLQYIQGQKQLLRAIQSQLEGKEVGDECDFVLNPEQAYGYPKPEAYQDVGYEELPPREQLKIGMILQEDQEDGTKKIGRIVQINEDGVVLSFNHPMAGKQLHYHVEIAEIQ